MRAKAVVEWAPFRLAEGVSEEQLLRASNDLQVGFLAKQRGFVRRELLRGKDRQWVDVVFWEDQQTADEAMKAAAESPACHEYFKMMLVVDHADPSAGVLHFEQVESYK